MTTEEIQKLADQKYPKHLFGNSVANPAFVVGGMYVNMEWGKKNSITNETIVMLSRIIYDQHHGNSLTEGQKEILQTVLKVQEDHISKQNRLSNMANLPEVDSAGTPLPKPIFLLDNCSAEDICKAMTLNSFSLAASVSMANGYKVFYDPETKKAEIVHPNGQISEIQHS